MWKEKRGLKLVDEIRLVYDATKSGLNGDVWTPWFVMSTIDSHLRAVETRTFMADCDASEIFLNFMLEPAIRSHVGANLSKLFPFEGDGKLIACWKRIPMGFGPSPNFVTKNMMVIEEAIRGLRFDVKCLCRWLKVVFNLSCMKSYDPLKALGVSCEGRWKLGCGYIFVYQ